MDGNSLKLGYLQEYNPNFKILKLGKLSLSCQKTEVVEPLTAEYYSQAVLSPKPHTNKQEWRFCLDYRALNDESDFQSWPLPNTSQTE